MKESLVSKLELLFLNNPSIQINFSEALNKNRPTNINPETVTVSGLLFGWLLLLLITRNYIKT